MSSKLTNRKLNYLYNNGSIVTTHPINIDNLSNINNNPNKTYSTNNNKISYNNGILNITEGNTSAKIDITSDNKSISFNFSVKKKRGKIRFSQLNVSKILDSANFTNELTKIGDGNVTYASSNPSIASVNANGVIDILGTGSVVITATINDSAFYEYRNNTTSFQVNVERIPGTFTCNTNIVTELNNTPTITYSKTGDGVVTFTTSNAGIATVDGNGLIRAVGLGSTTIIATISDTASYVYPTNRYVINVTVNKITSYIGGSSISIRRENATLIATKSISPSPYPSYYPTNSGDGKLSFSTSDSKIRLADENELKYWYWFGYHDLANNTYTGYYSEATWEKNKKYIWGDEKPLAIVGSSVGDSYLVVIAEDSATHTYPNRTLYIPVHVDRALGSVSLMGGDYTIKWGAIWANDGWYISAANATIKYSDLFSWSGDGTPYCYCENYAVTDGISCNNETKTVTITLQTGTLFLPWGQLPPVYEFKMHAGVNNTANTEYQNTVDFKIIVSN